ncbi:hypothetical protein O6H91_04G145300 [Diphasiastrum complanatum]|uniref:Uncharacterized protein n=2 Tax=Diphasiastrum complanatum TaxID=34168 RepID=A0ACC2E2P8_DIPCM|nr:hypothetical protein O6H91_04G145300 [Diphasiastrum complanatum]
MAGSPASNCSNTLVDHVILDLDGTLIDTETLLDEVYAKIVWKYGKKWEWDGIGLIKRLGKRPLEVAASLVEDYELPCTADELLEESLSHVETMWSRAKALPGATRLLKHLRAHKIPIGLASNSPAKNIRSKLAYQPGWLESFKVIVAGDEVKEGKPSPEIYLEAAKLLKARPSSCLVIEDSPTGVIAGKAAGMKVVAVPSIPSKIARTLYSGADSVLNSLLDFRPELWGLPPFQDWVGKALPIEPWCLGGPVIKGFGRGSKVLGIPTANLPTAALGSQLSQHVCGIYLGWAGLSNRGVYKIVMSVGWNPFFDNAAKTVEPWLLHDFPDDFYGEELRLIVVGYIRPEANFSSLELLIERIHEDAEIAKAALDLLPFSSYQDDKFLTTPLAKQ